MDVGDVIKKNEPRFPKMVGTRFTLSEYEKIRTIAAAAGMSVCAYVRLRTIGGRIKSRIDKKAIDDAINELRQTKGLMKHLHNEGQRIPFGLVQRCDRAIDRFLTLDMVNKDGV